LKEHINSNLHSTAFISDALNVVQWLDISESEDARAYGVLRESMRKTSEEQLRRGAYDALSLFKNHYFETFEDFAYDSDLNISQRSLYWLVSHGESNYLPGYVSQSWKLFNVKSASAKSNIAGLRDLQLLLTELIPDSKSLFSKQSQLQWLESNLASLKWDKDKRIYRIEDRAKTTQ
jgi:hypothetical protein